MYTVQVKVRLPSTAVVGSYLLVRGIKKKNNKKWRGKTDIRIQGVIVPEIYIQLWPINIVVGQIAPPFPIRNSLIRKIFVFLQKPDFLAKPVFWSDQKTTLVWPENRKIEIFHMRSSFSCRKPIFFFWPFFAGDFTVPAAWFTPNKKDLCFPAETRFSRQACFLVWSENNPGLTRKSENRNFPYEIFVFLQKTDFFFLAIFCGGFHGSCRLIHLQEFQEFSSPAIHMTLQSLGQENDYA